MPFQTTSDLQPQSILSNSLYPQIQIIIIIEMRVEALLALLPLVAAAPHKRAPLHIPRDVELIEGKYIVKMKEPSKDGVSAQMIDQAVASIASKADFVYDNIGGFASSLTEEEIEKLRNDPNVSSKAAPGSQRKSIRLTIT